MKLTKVCLGLALCSFFFQSESKALSITRDVYGNYVYSLQTGESVTNQRVMPNDTITCGYSIPQPPPPPPPPPMTCAANSVLQEISNVNRDLDKVENAKCPEYSFTVRRCGDWLEDHAVGSVISEFKNKVRNIKAAAEDLCRGPNGCDRNDVRAVSNRANDLINRTKLAIVKVRTGDGVYQTRQEQLNDGQTGVRCW